MEWMDIPSVTEMDRGGVYEMDRQTKCQKIEMPLKLLKILLHILVPVQKILENFIHISGISIFWHLVCLSISKTPPFL